MGLSKQIAYRLQTLRAAAGLSQQEVAERAELSLSLVAKMEQGRKADPRASTLLALAAALGVRPGQLIEDLVSPPEDAFPAKKEKRHKDKAREKKGKKLSALIGPEPSPNGHPAAPGPAAEGDKPGKKKRKKGK